MYIYIYIFKMCVCVCVLGQGSFSSDSNFILFPHRDLLAEPWDGYGFSPAVKYCIGDASSLKDVLPCLETTIAAARWSERGRETLKVSERVRPLKREKSRQTSKARERETLREKERETLQERVSLKAR